MSAGLAMRKPRCVLTAYGFDAIETALQASGDAGGHAAILAPRIVGTMRRPDPYAYPLRVRRRSRGERMSTRGGGPPAPVLGRSAGLVSECSLMLRRNIRIR